MGKSLLAATLGLALAGCGSFLAPGFLDLVDPGGTSATIENPRGHVVITFVNNAEVDERLITFLESPEGGNLTLTEAEKRALRPRVRLRVRVTFVDGSQTTVEFVDGSPSLVDQNFDAQTFPDLNQNDLDTVVVLCDVAGVEIAPGSSIEVFVPVQLTAWQFVELTNAVGGQEGTYQQVTQEDPRFRQLELDDVDFDQNVLVQRNIGIRDAPTPVANPLCGSVIAIVMDGVLAVPFLGEDNAPSYDIDDLATQARIGGRFEFTVSVQ